jgi:hypothetical protein
MATLFERARRKVEEANQRILEEAERLLPLTRPLGIVDYLPGAPQPKPSSPKPLKKTYQFTPTVPSKPFKGSVRFQPQPMAFEDFPQFNLPPTFERTIQETKPMIEDTGDTMLNELLTAGVSEIEILQMANRIEQEVAALTPGQRRERARAIQAQSFGDQFAFQNIAPPIKKKRKVSKYQKRFGIELKKLKKLHPRTKIQNLMKRAHRATKRALK